MCDSRCHCHAQVEYLTGDGAGRAVTYNINTYVHLLSNSAWLYVAAEGSPCIATMRI